MSNSMPNDDQKILSQLSALHSRCFDPGWGRVELSRWEQTFHIQSFILGCYSDVEPPTWAKIHRYFTTLMDVQDAKFNPRNIAHLDAIAEEILR